LIKSNYFKRFPHASFGENIGINFLADSKCFRFPAIFLKSPLEGSKLIYLISIGNFGNKFYLDNFVNAIIINIAYK